MLFIEIILPPETVRTHVVMITTFAHKTRYFTHILTALSALKHYTAFFFYALSLCVFVRILAIALWTTDSPLGNYRVVMSTDV